MSELSIMRLHRFEINRFKAIESLNFEWDDFVVFIGENNCGKSCVLSALSWFLSGSAIKDPLLFHKHLTDEANAIELIGHFDQLTPTDLEQVAVKGRTSGNAWILKKKFWLETADANEEEKSSWKEMLYSYSGQETFAQWPTPDTTWTSFPADYQPLIQQIADRPAKPTVASRETLRALVKQHRPDLVGQAAASWVQNPGGGGNWKSNANSILPRSIFIKAVQEASDEATSKEASTYGKLVSLIVENKLAARDEMATLRTALQAVMQLFCPEEGYPERQAQEIRDLEKSINEGLREVIGGEAKIRTEAPELNALLLPNTSLVIRDANANIETKIQHQGHGLQRTLIMTLLQLLVEAEEGPVVANVDRRPIILVVEEPELYLHPQMERRMRDVLYRLAAKTRMQVACCTHSPIFLDIAERHKSIVRMTKSPAGDVSSIQVTQDIFVGTADAIDKARLQTVARFNPAINELFFSKDVVLLEEFTAVAAFERAADITGIFSRHPAVHRSVALVDSDGKYTIPAFQKTLNAFSIPYRIIHDEDRGNASATAENAKILSLAVNSSGTRPIHMVGPTDIESVLGYQASSGSKPFAAVRKVEELHANNSLPPAFIQAVNFAYFGTLTEPAPSN
jgi:putative ATP-dependent endonuclease of the OLD family